MHFIWNDLFREWRVYCKKGEEHIDEIYYYAHYLDLFFACFIHS